MFLDNKKYFVDFSPAESADGLDQIDRDFYWVRYIK